MSKRKQPVALIESVRCPRRKRLADAFPEEDDIFPNGASNTQARSPRSMDQIINAIKQGHTNHRSITGILGTTPVTVAKQIEWEWEQAGIARSGKKWSLRPFAELTDFHHNRLMHGRIIRF